MTCNCIAAALIDCQIRLRILELGEKAIRQLGGGPKDIDFIRVYVEPLALRAAADVAYFEAPAFPELLLNTQIPRFACRVAGCWGSCHSTLARPGK